jgi:uncharacterized membrane protein
VEGLKTLERTVHHASKQLSYTVLVASMIMASSVLVLAARGGQSRLLDWIGFGGFLVSFTLAFLILIVNLWTKLRRKKHR